MATSRPGRLRTPVAALAGTLLLGAAGCSGGECRNGVAVSCASIIGIDGVRYIGGRGGDGAEPVPTTGTLLHGTVPACGCEPARPGTAHVIPGVAPADAVAEDAGEVMLAERLWEKPRSALPAALQPYVHR